MLIIGTHTPGTIDDHRLTCATSLRRGGTFAIPEPYTPQEPRISGSIRPSQEVPSGGVFPEIRTYWSAICAQQHQRTPSQTSTEIFTGPIGCRRRRVPRAETRRDHPIGHRPVIMAAASCSCTLQVRAGGRVFTPAARRSVVVCYGHARRTGLACQRARTATKSRADGWR